MSYCAVHKENYIGGKCPRLHIEDTTDDLLEKRCHRYGNSFSELATVIQNIKRALKLSPGWNSLSDDKKEALEMIATKLGRIVVGDANYDDSWADLMGYSKLILNSLEEEND